MNLDEISDNESYWGEVVDTNDPKHASRIRVRVVSVFDEIPVEYIPWAFPRHLDGQSHDLPALGDIVQIKFLNDDIYFPTWYRIRKTGTSLSEDDYLSGSIIIEKDLSKYNSDGSLSVRYTKSEGLLLELTRNEKTSHVIIRNDNSVILQNGNTGRIIHISNESISIGSETKSQQPSVVGDDNKQALEYLNDEILKLSENCDEHLKKIAKIAKSNPYTSLLSPPLLLWATSLTALVKKHFEKNDKFFPETLSKISTIDKT